MKIRSSILLSASLFVITAGSLPAQTLSVLHTFSTNTTDGRESLATLALSGSTLYGTTFIGGANNDGTVFKVDTNGANFQLLKSFPAISLDAALSVSTNFDGALPEAAGVVVSGDSLYGTTYKGGTNGEGVLFSMNTDGGNYQLLHVFGNGADDGAEPDGGLTLSGDTLYGTTQFGGTANFGSVYAIKTNGVGFQLLHSFAITSRDGNGDFTNFDGANPYDAPLVADGVLYGTTESAGTGGAGTVFCVNTDGNGFRVLHTFESVTNFVNREGGNCQAPLTLFEGRLYGCAHSAGLHERGTFFSLSTNGGAFTVLHQFQGPPDGSSPLGGMTVLGTRIYGTASNGGPGTNSGAVFLIDPANSFKVTTVYAFRLGVANGISTFTNADGSEPWDTLLASGNTVYGTTSAGGTNGAGTVFALTLPTTPDSTDPTLSVSSPIARMRVTNAVITAVGKAKDNVGVTAVYYQINGGAWTLASSSDGWTDWTAQLNLSPYTNTLRVYAVDGAGNFSHTNTVNFVYVIKSPLTVQTVGKGTLIPNDNGKSLQLGRTYSMTALADPGFGFLGWSGDLLTNSAKLKFEMEPGLNLVANFVDTKRPVVVIKYPPVNHVVSNSPITIVGKASDNVGVATVQYQLETGALNTATTSNGFANWTAPNVSLHSGTNIVHAFALDAAGNVSLTNSVRFIYRTPPDWAFESLTNLVGLAVPKSGKTTRTAFGTATFSQTGPSGDLSAADFGVGNYMYQKTGTNAAHLVKTFTSPLSKSNVVADILLTFTGPNRASFTNQSNGEHGTVTYSSAAAIAPSSLAGNSITAHKTGGGTVTIALNVGGTYVQHDGSKLVSGEFTYAPYSPTGAMLQLNATDPQDAGSVTYVQLTFSAAKSGTVFVLVYGSTGTLQKTVTGTFITN